MSDRSGRVLATFVLQVLGCGMLAYTFGGWVGCGTFFIAWSLAITGPSATRH